MVKNGISSWPKATAICKNYFELLSKKRPEIVQDMRHRHFLRPNNIRLIFNELRKYESRVCNLLKTVSKLPDATSVHESDWGKDGIERKIPRDIDDFGCLVALAAREKPQIKLCVLAESVVKALG